VPFGDWLLSFPERNEPLLAVVEGSAGRIGEGSAGRVYEGSVEFTSVEGSAGRVYEGSVEFTSVAFVLFDKVPFVELVLFY